MNMKHINYIILSAVLTLCAACGQSSSIQSEVQTNDSIIAIREQGSFLIGGTVKAAQGTYDTNQPLKEDGQTLHGDHAYVSYQIPANTRKYPLVFLHGAGQSAKTWESTPDGREGFATLFLRRGFSTYLIDQPRRGRAGRSTVDENIKATPDDQFWFENFRMGIWPNYYENSQFPQSEESLDQFFRQITPNTGAYDAQLIATDVAALMNKLVVVFSLHIHKEVNRDGIPLSRPTRYVLSFPMSPVAVSFFLKVKCRNPYRLSVRSVHWGQHPFLWQILKN